MHHSTMNADQPGEPGDHTAHVLEIKGTQRDAGYTLIELLLVVLIMGILGAAALLAVSGMSSQAAETGCAVDARNLQMAAEAYFAEHGNGPIPATGTDPDRYERTLVNRGFLRALSEFHDLDAGGVTSTKAGTQC